jgi:hypothetical protein
MEGASGWDWWRFAELAVAVTIPLLAAFGVLIGSQRMARGQEQQRFLRAERIRLYYEFNNFDRDVKWTEWDDMISMASEANRLKQAMEMIAPSRVVDDAEVVTVLITELAYYQRMAKTDSEHAGIYGLAAEESRAQLLNARANWRATAQQSLGVREPGTATRDRAMIETNAFSRALAAQQRNGGS